MVDYSVFDSILDAAIVVDANGKVVYCNDAAATFFQVSIRRTVDKARISDLVEFKWQGILPFNESSPGRTYPSPFIETEFNLLKGSRTGKVQLTIRSTDEKHWVFFLRDVSLEEALHSKYRSELSQKEAYARNLEKLVEARTAELNSVNQTLKAILNSLGQGFFTFNIDGECGGVFTKACEEILEGTPTNRKVWEVLAVPPRETEQFHKWSESMFKEVLPFDDLKGLGPSLYEHSNNRRVVLEYYPIRNEDTSISDIVVVATDKTAEFQAQQALEIERQYANMIVKYMKNKDQFLQFLATVKQSFAKLQGLARRPLTSSEISESFRILHTLEGESGTFSLRELRHLARVSQTILEPFRGQEEVSAQAHLEYVKSLENLEKSFQAFLSENSNVFHLPQNGVSRTVELSVDSIQNFLNQLKQNSVSAKLLPLFQDTFLKVPIEERLRYFDTLVQAVAEKLDKKVHPIVVEGGEYRIYPEPYQKIFSSLVHAFRNAVDHGLEMPGDRQWAGKDPAGQIRIRVEQLKGAFSMTISDDGRGIDPNAIREKLMRIYPEKDFSNKTDEEIIQSVCLPGFSSRDSVGEFSGRGVGLDALREEVLSIGGTLYIKSKLGAGTEIQLTIPEFGFEQVTLRSA